MPKSAWPAYTFREDLLEKGNSLNCFMYQNYF